MILKLLYKEMKLSSSPLSYVFLVFALTALIPGYPILMGSFFVGLGLFHSFQTARESNDVGYASLLPVAKEDYVKGKFAFCVAIELCYFVLTTGVVLLRMTYWSESVVYRENALMNANLTYLGFTGLILGLFNYLFVGGFFKTGYRLGKPFVAFVVASFLVVGSAEGLCRLPAYSALNAPGWEEVGLQARVLRLGAIAFAGLTFVSARRSIANFKALDL